MPSKKVKITKREVDQLQTGEWLCDTEIKGFLVRCLPSGTKLFNYRYRDRKKGIDRCDKLGIFPAITAEEARNLAK
jgi:hypothetical protein